MAYLLSVTAEGPVDGVHTVKLNQALASDYVGAIRSIWR
jgi:hypothetical protein